MAVTRKRSQRAAATSDLPAGTSFPLSEPGKSRRPGFPKSSSRQPQDGTATLALAFIDLRAHFEAQLRIVVRAEQTLLKCRGTHDAPAFDAAADTLRAEVQAIADNRRSTNDLVDQVIADARGLIFVE